jgi:hypothetical protein
VVELVPLRPEEAIAAVRAECERMLADPEFSAKWARALAMAERDLAASRARSVVRANSTTETIETSKGGSDPGAG